MKPLVTAAEVKQHTQVEATADPTTLAKAVDDATTTYLRPLLGAALLAELLELADTAPAAPELTGLSVQATQAAQAAYATACQAWETANAGPLLLLWEQPKFKRCLAQWVFYHAWPDLLMHVDAAGIVLRTGSSQGTTSADANTLNMGRNHQRDTAISRGNELVSWLEARRAAYPAYVSTRPGPTNAQPIDLCGGLDFS